MFNTTPGRKQKRASSILLRRTKQGIAEWYITEMLEKSWDGFEEHTTQGWNVGKAPYGYVAERHKHPVPAKRAEGKHKTKLTIDQRRGPVVEAIYALRTNEKLSYRAIADRLNTDLDRYPPPQPVDPERAVGRWTGSAVREILFNPKYTGHMVWNRRSTKDKLHPGKNNPVDEWIVSAETTHPGIITIEAFVAAQNVAASRRRSRADAVPATPNKHPQTRRVYALRSYVWCARCARRMFGRKVPGDYIYYSCQPRERPKPDGHPRTLSLPEDRLIDALTTFFNTHVFGTDRIRLASNSANLAAQQEYEEHQARIIAIRHALADLTSRKQRLARVLESNDDTDGSLFKQTQERHKELDAEYIINQAELEHLELNQPAAGAGAIDLLAHLPEQDINLAALPIAQLRAFLDAFAVQLHYDLQHNRLTVQATISAHAVPGLTRIAKAATTHPHTPKPAVTSTNGAAPTHNGGGSADLQIYDMPRRGHRSRQCTNL
jgi:hypothetical protein